MDYFVHETSVIDEGVEIGPQTKIWHYSHVMKNSTIGAKSNIGQNVVIGPDVHIGQRCKIQNNVSVYKGVTLEDDVFCGPSMVFTNVFNPRAHVVRMDEIRPIRVKKGASLGANCTIISGVTIGKYAMVGAGAVVTKDVPDHALVMGNPAKQSGWMCECGEKLNDTLTCPACRKAYPWLEKKENTMAFIDLAAQPMRQSNIDTVSAGKPIAENIKDRVMTIEGKKIFISGGAGFIGSTLAGKLCDENEIVLFDNLARNTIQYTGLLDHRNISLIKGDVLDQNAVRSAMQGADIVVHAAAIAGIDTVIKKPVKTMEVNLIGTTNVLKAAMQNKVQDRVLDFSTSEIFGSMAYRVSEDTNTVAGSAGEARWVYAVSKLAGEHLASAYYHQYRLPTVTVRPFNVYGPGQTGEGALQIFIRKALKNEDIFIYGDGSQIRAWCYVDDMVAGLMCALENEKAVGEAFNIGNSKAVTTIYGLAETVCRVLGSSSKIVFKPPLSADIELRIPETQKAFDLLGFRAQVSLEDGIRKTAEWYERNIA